ncbi:MAG: FAD binding domain-containing protein [Acetobacteraceae bacterium]|nr:FAD binding domain-containing protein [Acetobacteraceae bacterium]
MAAAPYHRPETLEAALALLQDGAAPPIILAGGTDLYPAQAAAEAWMCPAPARRVLDISALSGLDGIEDRGEHHRIGARVTWAALRDATHLPAAFDGLRAAARQVGGAQVQNRATVLGNLCNASPAADGVPPLLALGAEVELASAARGTRRLPLAAFILGNRRTALAPDELALAVLVPRHGPGARGGFLKLGARSHLVISIAMVAGVIEVAAGRVAAARLAAGACSAVAQRLLAAEAAIVGRAADPPALAAAILPRHLGPLSPIDDVRATAAYRREAALVLLRRLVAGLAAPDRARVAA